MFTGIETINPQLRKSAARRRSRPRQQPELDPTMPKLTQSPAWQALAAHYQALKQAHMRDLFMPDPARFDKFSLGAAGLSLDYSKNRVRGNVLAADRFGPPSRRGGQGGTPCSPQRKINAIEKRAVLHVALRNRSDRPISIAGEDVMPQIKAVLARLRANCFAQTEALMRGKTAIEARSESVSWGPRD